MEAWLYLSDRICADLGTVQGCPHLAGAHASMPVVPVCAGCEEFKHFQGCNMRLKGKQRRSFHENLHPLQEVPLNVRFSHTGKAHTHMIHLIIYPGFFSVHGVKNVMTANGAICS